MTKTETWLKSQREILAAATKGPWEPCLGSGNDECTAIHFEGNKENPYGLFVCDLVPDWALDEKYKKDLEYKPANMEFIAQVRTEHARALLIIEKLREALEVVDKYGDEIPEGYVREVLNYFPENLNHDKD